MPAADDFIDLELRRLPTQSRAVATFDRVLDTTASLLESHGFDALNTNLIAETSGVSVRAIYRYFPNKHAIVGELARRMGRQWRAALGTAGELQDPSLPWRDVWCSYIDAFVAAVRATNGSRAVLSAMRADPELRKVDEEANAEYINDITDVLENRARSTPPEEIRAVATVLIRSTVAVLDEAFESSEAEAARLIAVLKAMHIGLLGDYLD